MGTYKHLTDAELKDLLVIECGSYERTIAVAKIVTELKSREIHKLMKQEEMNKLEKLIRELIEKGFFFSGVRVLETGELAYELQGFYKSGDIKLFERNGSLFAMARYDELTELSENEPFDSLISLNYQWWQSSKDRWGGWKNPEEKWLKYFLEKGLVKESTQTTKTYE